MRAHISCACLLFFFSLRVQCFSTVLKLVDSYPRLLSDGSSTVIFNGDFVDRGDHSVEVCRHARSLSCWPSLLTFPWCAPLLTAPWVPRGRHAEELGRSAAVRIAELDEALKLNKPLVLVHEVRDASACPPSAAGLVSSAESTCTCTCSCRGRVQCGGRALVVCTVESLPLALPFRRRTASTAAPPSQI